MATSTLLTLAFAMPASGMPICGAGPRVNCVVDGDTVWIQGEKIRLEAIDTAEMGPPNCSGPASAVAIAARDRLASLMDGSIRLARSGTDRFGRTLANIEVDGRDVGAVLLEEGLARTYQPGAVPWC